MKTGTTTTKTRTTTTMKTGTTTMKTVEETGAVNTGAATRTYSPSSVSEFEFYSLDAQGSITDLAATSIVIHPVPKRAKSCSPTKSKSPSKYASRMHRSSPYISRRKSASEVELETEFDVIYATLEAESARASKPNQPANPDIYEEKAPIPDLVATPLKADQKNSVAPSLTPLPDLEDDQDDGCADELLDIDANLTMERLEESLLLGGAAKSKVNRFERPGIEDALDAYYGYEAHSADGPIFVLPTHQELLDDLAAASDVIAHNKTTAQETISQVMGLQGTVPQEIVSQSEMATRSETDLDALGDFF